MLFAVDVGNTNLTLGVYLGDQLAAHWRLKTDVGQTVDGWGVLFRNLFVLNGLEISEIRGIIISSVVPQLDSSLEKMADRYFRTTPLFVTSTTDTGLTIATDNPEEVGADRIVNGVAAYARTRCATLVVDFGTATTFDAISARGEYLGGAIAPGIGISAEALFARAARLPRVEVRRPPHLIGRNTVHSLQSGLFHGYLALVDGMVRRMKEELDGEAKVIATGGLAEVLGPDLECVDDVDPLLTLQGLRLLHERNRT